MLYWLKLHQWLISPCIFEEEEEEIEEEDLTYRITIIPEEQNLKMDDDDSAISAAVGMVLASAREGVISLCANIANIIREKQILQEQVRQLNIELEHERLVGSMKQSQQTSEALQEAPPQFARDFSFLHLDSSDQYSLRMKRSHSGGSDAPQNCTKNNFVRRNYRSFSWRHIKKKHMTQDHNLSEQPNVPAAQKNIRSNSIAALCSLSRKSSVHLPNSERDTIYLLASSLRKYITSAGNCVNEGNVPSQYGVEAESSTGFSSQVPFYISDNEVMATFPLLGCHCHACLALSEASAQLFALTSEDHLLLPAGSYVLLTGEKIGQVIYLGHPKETKISSASKCEVVGVYVSLFPPDDGAQFFPLSQIICPLSSEENSDCSTSNGGPFNREECACTFHSHSDPMYRCKHESTFKQVPDEGCVGTEAAENYAVLSTFSPDESMGDRNLDSLKSSLDSALGSDILNIGENNEGTLLSSGFCSFHGLSQSSLFSSSNLHATLPTCDVNKTEKFLQNELQCHPLRRAASLESKQIISFPKRSN